MSRTNTISLALVILWTIVVPVGMGLLVRGEAGLCLTAMVLAIQVAMLPVTLSITKGK